MPSRSQHNSKYSSSQLLNFARESYLERTSRPIYAVVFLLPFIVVYELGTLLINTDVLTQSQIRVVAFVWLQDILAYAGFGSRFAWVAAPLAVIIILLALQVTSRSKWAVKLKDIFPMLIECIVLAIPLIVFSVLLNRPAVAPRHALESGSQCTYVAAVHKAAASNYGVIGVDNPPPLSASSSGLKSPFLVNVVTGIGAGIYEELVFRLILICLLMLVFEDIIGIEHSKSLIIAILVSAALFSAHHHIIFIHGRFDQTAVFSWAAFVFRTIAGVYFAVLFAVRGFGITAGTHAFYDIIAAGLNASFFAHQ